jgi:hypothetical protein
VIRDVDPFLRIGASQYPSQRRDAPRVRYTEDIATSVQGQQGATSGPHAKRLRAKCSRSLRRRRWRALEESREMPASARVPNMSALLGIALVWSIASTAVGARESWINRGGYRNSAGEWCCGDNDCVRSRLPGRVGSSAARNSSRSTRPRQVRTERTGSAAGPITHAVVYSDRHPARSATASRQDQTNFSKIS